MSEAKFNLSCWAVGISGVLIFLGMAFLYEMRADDNIIAAIKAGATPLEAACAISSNPSCRMAVLLERQRSQEKDRSGGRNEK